MINLRTIFSRQVVSIVMALSLVGLPLTPSLTVYADDPAPCTAPAASTTFHYPNGADSGTFTYNCDSGLWENAHYTFDPANSQRTPKDPITYVCDPDTNTFNVTTWSYSPGRGTFVAYTQNVSQPPAGASTVDCPPLPAPPKAAITTANSSNSPSSPTGSASTTDTSTSNAANLNNLNNLTVNNLLTSTAVSGNAIAMGNTTVGNLSTGNATIMANELNMLQSINNFGSGGQPATFIANINGDVNGDFLLDPATISTVQPASSTNTTNNALNNDLTINNTTNATLNTTLNLDATSGDATANANTTVGDVSTGTANAVADIVNTINSAITAGHSFVGVININGNLNGDILLPPNFVDQLLAANVPTVNIVAPGNGSGATNAVNNTTNVTNTNNQGIVNNVKATAGSGTATANGNTSVGNLSTGNATTNITAFNLTGSKVIGSNDLLVFVNVLGKWVGLIVKAPAGATAASLGGGIIGAGPNSTNTVNNTTDNTANVTNKTTQQINNNININAQSGNASADRNTTVGNVKSGDAKAAVNLMNIENSTITLSNWFGILFINVFGSWHGSFGVNTSAGDPIATPTGATGPGPVISFVPDSGGAPSDATFAATIKALGGGGATSFFSAPTPASAPTESGTVIAANTVKSTQKQPASPPSITASGHMNWPVIIASCLAFGAYLYGERLYNLRQIRKS